MGIDQLFTELLDVAADNGIEDDPYMEFYQTMQEAEEAAIRMAISATIEPIPGGYRVTSHATADLVERYAVTRESQQWWDKREMYEEQLADVRAALLDHHPLGYDEPLRACQRVHAMLMQRQFPPRVEADDVTTHHEDTTTALENALPEWDNIGVMGDRVNAMHGELIDAFETVYLGQLPYILSGQLTIAGYLVATLAVAKTAMRTGVDDAEELIIRTTEGLAAGMTRHGGGVTSLLTTGSELLGMGSTIVGFIPGGQGIAAIGGSVARGAGIVAKITERFEDENEYADVSADHTDGVVDKLERELSRIVRTIFDVENDLAPPLGDLADIVENSDHTIDENIDNGYGLTLRDAWFRPKPPTAHTDGPTEIGGEGVDLLQVEIGTLRGIATSTLPAMADAYSDVRDVAIAAEDGVYETLSRPDCAPITGSTISSLWVRWDGLRTQLGILLGESRSNLESVGKVLATAVDDLETTDDDSSQNLARAAESGA